MVVKYIFILCVTFLFLPTIGKISPSSLLNHIGIVQEIKTRFKKQQKINKSIAPNKKQLTATGAYLSLPELSNNLNHIVATAKKQGRQVFDPIIIDSMINREKELVDSHYVFYHGQQSWFLIIQDFIKELYYLCHMRESLPNFEFLRFWPSALHKAESEQFIDAIELQSYPNNSIDDSKPNISKQLLSVNLSLFGNTKFPACSSLSYFMWNTNCFYYNSITFLEEIFDFFKFDKRFIERFSTLHDMLNTPQGLMTQIFIPKDKVDQCVYLSQPLGVPYRLPIETKYFNAKKNRHTLISAILEKYCNSPKAITNIDELQARILFSQDLMLNPDSGVKIFRYTMIPKTTIDLLKENLKKLTKEILEDWLKKSNKKENDMFQKTALSKLLHHLKQAKKYKK